MRITPRQKTNAGFTLALAAFLVIGAASYVFFDQLVGVSRSVDRLEEAHDALAGFTGRLADAEGRSRAYVLTGDPHQLALHQATVRQIPGALRRLVAALSDDPVRAALARQLAPLVQSRIAHFALTLEAHDRNAPDQELARRVAEGVLLTDSIRALTRRLETSRERQLGGQMAEAEVRFGWAPSVILFATLAGLLIVLLAMIAVNRDLAARERAASALREAQERGRVVLNTVVDGIVAVDESGRIEGMNPAAERLFGWTEAEALGRNVATLMPEPYAGAHDGYLARYLATGEAHAIGRTRDLLGRRRDGSTFTMELSLGEVRLEGRRLFTGVIRDISERKRLEAVVRETLALQRAILDSADNSIISTDPEGVIRTFNATAERWLGYTAEEVVGKTAPTLIHDRAEVAARAGELSTALGNPVAPGFDVFVEEAARGLSSQREWTYIRKDGSRFPVLLSVAALRDSDGAIAGFLGVATDLTQVKAAEAARRESESRYRSVVEVLGEGLYVQEATGHIVEANPAAERILGVTREELVGRHVTEVPWTTLREDGTPMPPEERPASTCLRTGQPVRNQVIGAHRPDGRLAWLLVNVQPLAFGSDGRPVAAVTSFSDISRRKEAEQTVRENQERLQDFLDNAHDFILSAGADGRLLYVNRAWEEALGIRAVDAVGRPFADFLDAACLERCRAAFAQVLDGRAVTGLEAVFVARDGRRITVLGSSNCRFEDGRPVATRSIFRDVTEIQRAQEALERARDDAERANRAKSEFLANMSHELRTPLNSVIGFAGVLLKNRPGNLRAEDVDFLSRIHDNGRHLLDLINSILDLSKVEAGKVELEMGPVALERVVEEALVLVAGQARPEVRLVTDVPAGLRPVRGDQAKLKQVLVNLLANALKFTERGSVTVRVAADPATGVPAFLEVRDTGIGIPADRLATVFDAFQQADTSTARRYGGTGLGLTISRSLVELMGYRIELESREGEGTAFRVVFGGPSGDGAGEHAAAPERDGADLAGALVLVIDDAEDSRRLLERTIAELGPRTIAAPNGAEGLRLARSERPDLVTVDLLMPGMTGWDFTRTMRADPELRGIPVVVVSVVAGERGGTVPGAADILDKPVDRDRLLAVLRRHLRGAARHSRTPRAE